LKIISLQPITQKSQILNYYLRTMFGKVGELKKMYDKYKTLQNALKNLVIRGKEGKFTDSEGNEADAVIVDISGEMKLRDLKINDTNLLNPAKKEQLEALITSCFQKAQTKAQEIAAEKTKEVLGFDPSNIGNMLGWWGIPGMS
jgi:DNA-binding protein YbaB